MTENMNTENVFFESLPFVCKPLDSCNNEDGLPNFLNFKAKVDTETGLIYQEFDAYVEECLIKSYQSGAMLSGLMSDSGNGRRYADDFFSFIKESYGDVSGKKILEIGCGTGYLMYRLEKLGAKTIGIEPGDSHKEYHEKYGVEVIDGFFPSEQLKDKYDIIIFYGVLEHITNTNEFLLSLKKYLSKKGEIILAVPDCEEYIKYGDISMFIHEHYNYFTQNTLSSCLYESRFKVTNNKKSMYGGLIYLRAGNYPPLPIKKDYNQPNTFFGSYKKKTNIIRDILIKHHTKSVGIYVCGRIINTLSILKNDVDLSNIRFFDDNPLLKNKYYPGFDIKIESLEDFLNRPPEVVLIMSRSFEDAISKNIRNKAEIVYPWSDIFLN